MTRAGALALGVLVGALPLAATAVQREGPAGYEGRTAVGSADVSGASKFGKPGRDYAADQVLVEFKSKAGSAAASSTIASYGHQMGERIDTRPDMATVNLSSGESVAKAVRDYENNPNVAHAQPNFIYRAAATTPDDPSYDKLWGLENTGQEVNGSDGGRIGADINAPEAWDLQNDCSDKTVAVLDTGMNYKHADVQANMMSGNGRDTVGDDPSDPTKPNDDDPMPYGGATHGTHVGGTIGAAGNNGTSVTGVCWNATLMSVRVLGPDGLGFSADLVEGIDYARNNGADIINMSLVGYGFDTATKTALEHARDVGILAVIAAGNNSNNLEGNDNYPCEYDLNNIICVAALDQDYNLAGFSNYGNEEVHVGAPGVDTLSTYPGPSVSWDVTTWDTSSGDWSADITCDSGFDYLVNPSNWCTDGSYSNNVSNVVAFKKYDMGGAIGGRYDYAVSLDLNDGGDSAAAAHEAGSDPQQPFDSGTIDDSVTGPRSDSFRTVGDTLTNCAGTNCSIGFRLNTDGSGVDTGVGVTALSVQKIVDGTSETEFLQGTSMATPHVAGIAALAWSVVPNKGYSEIRDAVIDSGDYISSLDTTTITGRAADAYKAILAANDAPTASDKDVSTDKDTSVDVTIDGSDPNGHTVSYSVSSQPSDGTVSLSGNTATYDPDSDFTGTDQFQVQIADDYEGASTATVSVDVSSSEDGGSGGGGGGGGSLGWIALIIAVLGLGRRGLAQAA